MARSYSRYGGLTLLCAALLCGPMGAQAGWGGFGGGDHGGGGQGGSGGGKGGGGGFLGGGDNHGGAPVGGGGGWVGGGDNHGGGGQHGGDSGGIAGLVQNLVTGVGDMIKDIGNLVSGVGKGAHAWTPPPGNAGGGNTWNPFDGDKGKGDGGGSGDKKDGSPAVTDPTAAAAATASADMAAAEQAAQAAQVQAAQTAYAAIAQAQNATTVMPKPYGTPPSGTSDSPTPAATDPEASPAPTGGPNSDLAAPLNTPAEPQPMASVDAPKRYQVYVPPLPPGRQYKGSDGGENFDPNKLANVVALGDGLSVDPGAMAPPASAAGAPGASQPTSYGHDAESFVRAHVTAGEAKLGLRDYQGALAEANQAIQAAPNQPDGYLLSARTLNKMGYYQQAEQMADKARDLALDPALKARAEQEVAVAQLYQGRSTDALASSAQALKFAQQAGSKGLEANAYYLNAAACQLKGDRSCMVDALARAAQLDSKYEAALAAAKAGRNIFDPSDKDSLGLLYGVGGSRAPDGLGALGGAALAAFAVLAALAGLAWRRSQRSDEKPSLAEAMGVQKDDSLLGGRYELGRAVPSGGRGETWEALDHSLGRQALVLRLPSESAVQEAKRLALVHHPNVIDVFEVIESPKGAFLVTEQLKGRTLRQVLAARGRLGLDEARRMLRPVCEALEYARGQGVVHGGLDLSGIMMSDEGYVKVLDLAGTRPETAGRTDVQALAGCLQELLTGEPPRPGQPPAGVPAAVVALLRDAASGAVPGPDAFAARLDRLAEGVAVG